MRKPDNGCYTDTALRSLTRIAQKAIACKPIPVLGKPAFLGTESAYYFNARWYNPELGKFISEDPIRDGDNWFAYCGNNPLVFTDQWGLNGNSEIDEEPEKKKKPTSILPMRPVRESLPLKVGGEDENTVRAGTPNSFIIESFAEYVDEKLGNLFGSFGKEVKAVNNRITLQPILPKEVLEAKFGLTKDIVVTAAHVALTICSLSAAGNVASPSGKQFSVAFETKLSPGTFPGKGRGVHFRDANQQLAATMKAYPEFAASMEKLIPGISGFLKTPRMASRSPTTLGWTWHHNVETGVMDLVPFSQHTDQLFQNVFHPGGVGGFSLWGK